MKNIRLYIGTILKCENAYLYNLSGITHCNTDCKGEVYEDVDINAQIYKKNTVLRQIRKEEYIDVETKLSIFERIELLIGIYENTLYCSPNKEGDLFVDKKTLCLCDETSVKKIIKKYKNE